MTAAVLLIKAGLDLLVTLAAATRGDYAGALLFLSFVLVDLASLGVLK